MRTLQGFYPKAISKNGCNMGVLVAIRNKCFEVGFVVSCGIYICYNRLLQLNFDVLRYFDFCNEHKKTNATHDMVAIVDIATNSIVALVIVATTHIVLQE